MKLYFLGLATIVAVCVGCAAPGNHMGHAGHGHGSHGECDSNIRQASYHEARQSNYYAPPAEMLVRPGPGVDGPGPGVMNMLAGGSQRSFATSTTQIRFIGPEGMQVGWQIPRGYAENQLTAPARYNFRQGATYRLKLTDIPEREGLVIYPTLQVYPSHPETDAYLAHNSVPLQITDEDLDQVQSNNFVTKVIYLPSAKHQELAIAGVETLVSTRLDPGVDPVSEADRRGTIMAVLRMGNMDLETPELANGGPMPEGVEQVSYAVDGDNGQHVPPMPISGAGIPGSNIPGPMMMGAPGQPGQSAFNPISGLGTSPSWGMPITGTPIGLPGPPHLPYGGKAGLKSHTVRNLTKSHIPEPVDHLLIDVRHNPGINLPDPVKHVEYTETHPVFVPRRSED
jgi:hypothetical protein